MELVVRGRYRNAAGLHNSESIILLTSFALNITARRKGES